MFVLGERVGVRIPVVSSGIDDLHGDLLRDNPFHDLMNGTLLVQTFFPFVVVGLDFVS